LIKQKEEGWSFASILLLFANEKTAHPMGCAVF
jgi:hypothetical protein